MCNREIGLVMKNLFFGAVYNKKQLTICKQSAIIKATIER